MWRFVKLAPRVVLLTGRVGVGGSSRSSEDPGHQLAGLGASRPTPKLLPAKRGQGRQGGSLCQDPYLSLDLALHKQVRKLGVCDLGRGLH